MKRILKKILPERLKGLVTGIFYGWSGNYSTWEEAEMKCSGYNSPEILSKVIKSAEMICDGKAIYERDTFLYDEIHYSFPVLSGLLWVSSQKNNRLNVLDYGGSLGSSYYQNKLFLDGINEVNWCIVEQPEIAQVGIQKFSTDRLHFFKSIDECIHSFEIDVLLLSSVLQYLKEPYSLLEHKILHNIKHLIIDRTPFINGPDRITVQKVHPAIYNATYPCWFFNKSEFLAFMSKKYELILEFDAIDKANIPSEFKGFIFRRS